MPNDTLTAVERLTEILSERKLPGTRNGPITEPRELAEHIVVALAKQTRPEPVNERLIEDLVYAVSWWAENGCEETPQDMIRAALSAPKEGE